jgi:hypothetical protein
MKEHTNGEIDHVRGVIPGHTIEDEFAMVAEGAIGNVSNHSDHSREPALEDLRVMSSITESTRHSHQSIGIQLDTEEWKMRDSRFPHQLGRARSISESSSRICSSDDDLFDDSGIRSSTIHHRRSVGIEADLDTSDGCDSPSEEDKDEEEERQSITDANPVSQSLSSPKQRHRAVAIPTANGDEGHNLDNSRSNRTSPDGLHGDLSTQASSEYDRQSIGIQRDTEGDALRNLQRDGAPIELTKLRHNCQICEEISTTSRVSDSRHQAIPNDSRESKCALFFSSENWICREWGDA